MCKWILLERKKGANEDTRTKKSAKKIYTRKNIYFETENLTLLVIIKYCVNLNIKF